MLAYSWSPVRPRAPSNDAFSAPPRTVAAWFCQCIQHLSGPGACLGAAPTAEPEASPFAQPWHEDIEASKICPSQTRPALCIADLTTGLDWVVQCQDEQKRNPTHTDPVAQPMLLLVLLLLLPAIKLPDDSTPRPRPSSPHPLSAPHVLASIAQQQLRHRVQRPWADLPLQEIHRLTF